MSLSEQIAEFISGTKYEDLPAKVVEKAKQCIADSIGVALYGSQFKAAGISLSVIEEAQGKKEASILGTAHKAPCFLAALANGIRAHVADYEDESIEFIGHPSCMLTASTLSVGEMKGADGSSLLTAFIVGSEVQGKLGRVMSIAHHYKAGWHATSTLGTIGAAMASARLLNLSPSRVVNALGIAASSAAGLQENFGTMAKSWHAGHASAAGVMAALLAQRGYDASSGALDGGKGFIKAFQGNPEATYAVEQLGNPYSIMEVAFKQYPSMGGTHAVIQAMLELKKQYGFHPQEVKVIESRIPAFLIPVVPYQEPQTGLEAKFSVEYCSAVALFADRPGIAQFTDEAVLRPEVREVMKKVSVVGDKALGELVEKEAAFPPAQVKVTLNDGREFSQTVKKFPGSPTGNEPLPWIQVEEKFLECAAQRLPLAQAQQALKLIRQLEQVDNIKSLTELCCLK